jgi:hypothetical protein
LARSEITVWPPARAAIMLSNWGISSPAFVQAIFDYSLSVLDAERRWLSDYLESL